MRYLLAVLSLVLSVAAANAQTGSAKTQSQLNTEIGTTGCSQPTCLFPDNTTGLITPFDIRQGLLDMVASQFNPLSDTFFGSGRPFCDPRAKGALGDGSHDDYPAFQQCNNTLSALGGGEIRPSPGHYCFKSGTLTPATAVFINAGVTAYDGQPATPNPSTVIDVCNTNATAINFANGLTGMHGIYVHGFGLGATAATVIIQGTGSPGILIENSRIDGGAPPLFVQGGAGATSISNTRIAQSYGGGALVLLQSNSSTPGFLGVGNTFDANWPTCKPANGSISAINAWAPTTTYPPCSVVSLSGYYIVSTSGSAQSGGSPPALLPYGQTITDGSGGLTWQLLRPAPPFYDVQCDTGCTELHEYFTDHSGGADAGLAFTNTLAGAVPANNYEIDSVFTDSIVNAIYAHDGNRFKSIGGRFGNNKMTNSAGIAFTGNWTGGDEMVNIDSHNTAVGVLYDTGITGPHSLIGAQISGTATAAVTVGASGVNIVGGNLGTGNYGANPIGVNFAAGAFSNLTVVGVDFSGATTHVQGVAGLTGTNNDIHDGPTALTAQIITPALPSAGGVGFSFSATQPVAPASNQNAISWTVTGAGSAAQNSNAFNLLYNAGYTGANRTRAAELFNQNAGTGTTLPAAGSLNVLANIGSEAGSVATTTGYNIGSYGNASGGAANFGTLGITQVTKAASTNIGMAGYAANSGAVQIGALASLNPGVIPSNSAAFIADNGTTGAGLMFLESNGSPVFTVDNSGNTLISGVTFTPTLYGGTATNSALTLSGTNSGSPSGDSVTVKSSNLFVIENTGTIPAAVFSAAATGVKMIAPDTVNTGYGVQTFSGAGINNFLRWDGNIATGLLPIQAANEELGRESYGGATSATNAVGGRARVSGFSSEAWSGTANGTYVDIYTTLAGTTSTTAKVRAQGSGGMSVGTANLATDGGNGVVVAGGYQAGATPGVSCAAGTVNLTTLVVTNGIVTHC